MQTLNASQSNADSSRTLWKQVVAEFRHACLLRREGNNQEATHMLSHTLPRTISLWTREDQRPAADKRAALEGMFAAEQAAVASWMFAYQSMASRLAGQLIPALRKEVTGELRTLLTDQFQALADRSGAGRDWGRSPASAPGRCGERIRFDDIPRVLDAVLAQQAADYGRGTAFAH